MFKYFIFRVLVVCLYALSNTQILKLQWQIKPKIYKYSYYKLHIFYFSHFDLLLGFTKIANIKKAIPRIRLITPKSFIVFFFYPHKIKKKQIQLQIQAHMPIISLSTLSQGEHYFYFSCSICLVVNNKYKVIAPDINPIPIMINCPMFIFNFDCCFVAFLLQSINLSLMQ